MGKITKKTLSVFLSVLMILSCWVWTAPDTHTHANAGSLTVTDTAATAIKSIEDTQVAFYVPEVVYLYPNALSWREATSAPFQYYVQNTINQSNIYATPTTNTNLETTGYIYFAAKDMKKGVAPTISANTDGSRNGGGSISSVTFKEENGYWIGTFSGTSPKLESDEPGCYIVWVLTYTTTTGETKSCYAYTYIYKPYVVPVGAAARARETHNGSTYALQITWISGVHSIDTTGTYKNRRKPNFMLSSSGSKGMLGFLSLGNTAYLNADSTSSTSGISAQISSSDSGWVSQTAGTRMNAVFASTEPSKSYFWANQTNSTIGNNGTEDWFNGSTTMGIDSFDYYSEEKKADSRHLSVVTYSGAKGVITIDSSRYANLSQIPNLGVGLLATEDQGGEYDAWHIADATGIDPNSTEKIKYTDYWQSDANKSTQIMNAHTKVIAGQFSNSTIGIENMADFADEGLKYAGTWPAALTSAQKETYTIKGHFGTCEYYKPLVGSAKYSYAHAFTFVDLKATQIDKSKLRTAVNNARAAFSAIGLQADGSSLYFNFPGYEVASPWLTFVNAYVEADKALCRVDAACEADALAEKLNNALAALKNGHGLKVKFDANADGDTSVSGIPGEIVIPAKENVNTAATYSNLPSSIPTRTGYTFDAWYFDKAGTSKVTSSTAVSSNLLYAKWDANEYKVTFDNMFDLAAWNVSPSDAKVLEKTSSSLTIVSNEYKMDSSGNQVDNNDGNTAWTYSIPVKANTTYVIEADIAFGENFSREMDIFAFVSAKDGTQDKDCIVLTENGKLEGGHPKVSSTTAGKNTLSFTTSDDSAFVRFRFDSNLAGNVLTISDIRMYEVGTVDAGAPYVPSVTVEYDGDYSKLPTPTRTGYTFLGWYDADGNQVKATDTVKITKDIVLYSKWEVSKYTIKWVNHDGTILETDENVTYGTTPAYNGATPTKPKDAQYTYTFAGWSPAISPATADVTYIAQFSNTTNKYTVTWKNHDGAVLKTEQVAYGTTPTAPADPTRESNQEFNYTFAGWDKEIAAVNGDVIYTATYTATKRSYTITWVVDGKETTETYEYGTTPSYKNGTPTKEKDAQYTYTFTGWSPAISTVTGNATYTAQFSNATNKYTITWLNDDDSVIDTTTVEYGTVPTHSDATKAATAQYTYTFAGWTPAVTAVTGDATYKATYTETVNSYTITWVVNGVETTESYNYGATPTYKNGTPTKAEDAQYTYSFAGWSPAVTEVTDNATYTAQFDKTAKDYTLTVEKVVNGETTTKTYTVKFGHSYNVTSEYGELTGYTRAVDGKLEGTMPANNVTVRVIYSPIDYTLTINYKYANGTQAAASHIASVAFGAGYDIASPAIEGYTPNPATVSGTMPAENVTVDVTYNVNSYTLTIKYQYEDGTEAKPDYTAQVEYKSLLNISSPEIEGYTANQSMVSVTMPAEDKTITVIYTKKTYKVTWVDWNDVELEVDEAVPYYTMPEFNGNKPTKAATAEYTYEHSGWTPVINFVTGDITYKATYTATKRSYEITWLNDDNTLIGTTTVEYGTVPTHEAVTKTADKANTYTFDKWVDEEGKTPVKVTGAATYKATYTATPIEYTLTINYKYANGTTAADTYTAKLHHEAAYNVNSPAVTGYTASQGVVSGTIDGASVTVDVTYSINSYNLTINYKYADGTTAAATHSATLEYGAEYSVASPAITGYTASLETVSGTMGASDVTVEVTYSVNSYTLTINYEYADGTQAAESHTESVKYGAEYSVDSPAITGYTADNATVSGTMPAENKKITVTYKKNSYTITWKNDDGSVIDTTTVEHGTVPTHADATKENTAEYTYTFDKWADANGDKLSALPAATGNATYTATYTATKNSYTITWLNDDDSVIDTTTVEYGTVPTHADATKTATAQYTYTFAGWTPAVTAVTGDATYKATYTETVNSYTITWVVNGVETTESYNYGATPSFKGSTDKAADAQYTYTFDSWSPAISTVTGNATYTATYSTTVNTYTVTWKNHDGTVLETDLNVPYGTIPTYDSTATPTKAADAQYTYTFAGWSPDVAEVTGNATYTATFTNVPNKYNVNWVVDGKTTSVLTAFGSDIEKLADPAKEGYTFKGWKDTEENIVETFGKMPANDVTYTAYFEINSYTVTWIVDGVTTTVTYEYDADIVMPADPTKAGYTFTGWTPEVPATMPASNQTFTATWHVNQYSITFDTAGGSIVSAIVKDYGARIEATDKPANPTKEGYTFKGWDKEIPETMPLNGLELKAKWQVNQYTITFDTVGGTEIAPITQDYNTAVTAPAAPTKEGHTFDGWDKAVPATMPAGNMTITAKWTVNQYTITFDTDGGSAVDSITADYGTAITAPVAPTKTGHTFDKWVDSDGNAVTFPVTMPVDGLALKAIWTPIKYTITFIGDNNVKLQSGQVAYGEKTEYNGAVPTKPDENGKTYAFSGWATTVDGTVLNALPSVTGDATYYAVFVGKDTKFNVIWKFESGDVTVEDVIYGTKAITKLPNDSTEKTADAEYSYQFKGWSISADSNETVTLEEYEIKAETIFYPVYEKTPVNYTVTWKDGDNKYTETTVAFDSKIVLPTNPEKTGYTFAGWFTNLDDETIEITAESTMPANNLTVYANWTVNQYDIVFDVNGGEGTFDAQKYTIETTTITLGTPVRTGYTFKGWKVVADDADNNWADVGMLKAGENTISAKHGNIKLEAQWTINQYTITIKFANGETDRVITQDYATVIEAPANPTKTGYTFAGWDKTIPATMPAENVIITAQWEAIDYTITWIVDGETVKKETLHYEDTVNVTAPAAPTKTGYTFAGWDKEVPAKMPAENITITAKWTANNYSIIFDLNGGKVGEATSVEGVTYTIADATAASIPAPSKEGYDLTGWTITAYGEGNWNTENTIIGSALTVNGKYGNIKLTAQWTAKTYTVTWVSDGATVGTSSVIYDTNIELKDAPAKTGYTFLGWYATIGNEEIKLENTTKMPADDITAYAKWETVDYTISFDLNGGSSEEITTITYDIEDDSVTLATPVKTGYTFAGWKVGTTSGNWTAGTEFAAGELAITKKHGDVNLVAQWTINQYTITFNTDGGSEVAAITLNYGETITAPAAPTKTGYTFAGWDKTIPATMPAGDMTITAQWTIKQYTITFDADGGSAVAPITQDYNTAVTAPANPTKTGYTFKGWTPAVPATMPAENVTIKAQWTIKQYTITFDTDGGTAVAPITQDYNTAVTTPANPTKTGYTFAGWLAEGSTEAIMTLPATMPAKDVTYTAQWTINKYTITFNTDGGSAVAPITQDYNTAVTAPANPTKTGHEFAGWDVEIPATMPAENVTIKAQWTIKQYTITFVTDGGTEISAITQDYGTAITAPADPEKEGYTFDGWDVEIPATMPAENMTVTANWEINQYKITFNTDGGSAVAPITQNYGTAITAPVSPTKTGYTFAGWSPALPTTMPANDMTIKATWTPIKYTITFVDEDGTTELYSADVDYDTVPEYEGETPEKAATAQYTYTFAGWTPTIVKVTGEATYKATYSSVVNKYTVTWTDGNGETLKIAQVEYGSAVPSYDGATPTKEYDETNHYTFADGWDNVPETVTGAVTITAKFTAVAHTYEEHIQKENDAVNHTDKCSCGYTKDAEHSYGEGEVTKAPTCQETGIETFTCLCEYKKTETLAKNPANHTSEETSIEGNSSPTCTEPGATGTEKYVCCGAVKTESTEIPALGHTSGSVVVENENAATCTDDGSYENVVYCTVCSVEISRETVIVPATGHTSVVDAAVEPTCTATGLTAGAHCGKCNAVITAQQIVPALGHKKVVVPAVPATCTEKGLTAGESCERCGLVFAEQTETSELGHNLDTSRTENNLTRPVLKDGEWTDGYYTFRCKREGCAYFETEAVKRADYSEYDKVMASIEKLLGDDSIPADAKAKLRKLLNERKDNYIATEQTILNKDVANIKNAISEAYPDAGFKLAIDGNRIHYIGTVLDLNVIKYNDDISVDAGNVQWLTSNENVVVYSNGKLLAVGTGKVKLTAVSGILETTFDVEIVEGGRLRTVKFTPIKGTYFIVEEYYITYDGATMYWSDNYDVYFRVRTTQSYSYETFMVYMNGKEIAPNAEGYYVVPADTGDVTITLSGAVFDDEGDGDNGTGKFNFWEWLLRLFRKIGDFFRNLFGIA